MSAGLQEEVFVFPGRIVMDYHYAMGGVGSRFLTELRDNQRIVGICCSECGRVYVPPRLTCARCFRNMEHWVTLSGRGTLDSFTIVHYSEPHHPGPPPVAYGLIHLDGADTGFVHLLSEVDPGRLSIGRRVEPVFREKREGNILDIRYFRPI